MNNQPTKECKWCHEPEPKHWPYQCFENPKRRKYKLRKTGSKEIVLQSVRRLWNKENPPIDDGENPPHYLCYICGRWLWPNEIELDHIKSRSRHPDLVFEISNLKAACHDCNTKKGSLDYEDYMLALQSS